MNVRKSIIGVASPLFFGAAVAAMVIGVALPASAADTAATFTIAASGGLSVAPSANANLGTAYVSGNTAISGSLGLVTVADGRGTTEGWTASAASTVFTGSGLSTSTSVKYVSGAVAPTGTSNAHSTVGNATQTVLPLDALTPFAPTPESVVVAVSSGNNTATWTPTLNVTMPSNALIGDYSGTVTTSVS